jgi:hypothetical protein
MDLGLYSKSSFTLKEWLRVDAPHKRNHSIVLHKLQLLKNSTHTQGKLKFGVKCEWNVYVPWPTLRGVARGWRWGEGGKRVEVVSGDQLSASDIAKIFQHLRKLRKKLTNHDMSRKIFVCWENDGMFVYPEKWRYVRQQFWGNILISDSKWDITPPPPLL